nr:MAG TPA: hypothetical protein [Caudoviricetes sp.]
MKFLRVCLRFIDVQLTEPCYINFDIGVYQF